MENRSTLTIILFAICFFAIYLSIKDLKQKSKQGSFQLKKEEKSSGNSKIPEIVEKNECLKISEILEERKKFMPNGAEIPNPDFIFHNKVPKSGSSTMKHILKFLSKAW